MRPIYSEHFGKCILMQALGLLSELTLGLVFQGLLHLLIKF